MSARSYLSIGDVLTLLRQEFPDITISKIRFLESQGLVNPERTPSGYRKFYEHDVERLRWVLRQQREHFLPLKVIKDRLDDGTAEDGPRGHATGGRRRAGQGRWPPAHARGRGHRGRSRPRCPGRRPGAGGPAGRRRDRARPGPGARRWAPIRSARAGAPGSDRRATRPAARPGRRRAGSPDTGAAGPLAPRAPTAARSWSWSTTGPPRPAAAPVGDPANGTGDGAGGGRRDRAHLGTAAPAGGDRPRHPRAAPARRPLVGRGRPSRARRLDRAAKARPPAARPRQPPPGPGRRPRTADCRRRRPRPRPVGSPCRPRSWPPPPDST